LLVLATERFGVSASELFFDLTELFDFFVGPGEAFFFAVFATHVFLHGSDWSSA
jgi:hypothetical protein